MCTAPQTLNFGIPLPQLFISKYTTVYVGQLHAHVCSPQAEEAENTALCSTANRSSRQQRTAMRSPAHPHRAALRRLPQVRSAPLSLRCRCSPGTAVAPNPHGKPDLGVGQRGSPRCRPRLPPHPPKAGARKRGTRFPKHGHLSPLQQAKASRSPFVTVPVPPPIPGIHIQAPFPSAALLPAAPGPGRSERVRAAPRGSGAAAGEGASGVRTCAGTARRG